MMIQITQRCTMGCKHCMDNASPNGEDMQISTFKNSLDFLYNHNLGLGGHLIITGGEPLEHKKFDKIINTLLEYHISHNNYFTMIIITTNGEHILDNKELHRDYIKRFKEHNCALVYQVSADVRYYSRRIPVNESIFKEPGFVLCDDCVQQIYPQGRAKYRELPYVSKAPKCYNVRSIVKQFTENGQKCHLANIEAILLSYMKFCTPHIDIHGNIKLGESTLCPPCGTIYDDEDKIIEEILYFNCTQCRFINPDLVDSLKYD